MQLGCHAVLFTDKIATDTSGVLAGLHSAGAQGTELGIRFFGVEKNIELRQALEVEEMVLAGLHVALPLLDFLDSDGTKNAMDAFKNAAVFLQVMPHKNIIFTGIVPNTGDEPNLGDDRLTDPKTLCTMAENIGEIARLIYSEYGVRINYHNHNWEYANDNAIFDALVKYAPDLFFALDVGWVAVAGRDPFELIPTLKGRLKYVHLRDYDRAKADACTLPSEMDKSYVDIGHGDMDFPRLMNLLQQVMGDDSWAVIEYEKGPVEFKRYADAVKFIKAIMMN